MNATLVSRRNLFWIVALAASFLFLAVDTSLRLVPVRTLYSVRLRDATVPQRDEQWPSGFQWNQHRLILPAGNVDSYEWIMFTERMLAREGLRIRQTAEEFPPQGREVHWSASLRLWLGSVAWIHQIFHPGESGAQALEQMAPSAAVLGLAVFMLMFTLLIARNFGPIAAALFPPGCVALYPFYQYSIAGMLDHHGFAAMAGFAAVIFLLSAGDALLQRSARPWFIASGVATGVGLWISAATMLPIAAAILTAAAVANLLLSSSRTPFDPLLWRAWGIAVCTTSIAFYILEYYPGHMGWRLEVNHPLYALALLGGGDLVARLGSVGTRRGEARQRVWLAVDGAAAAIAPATIAFAASASFRVADPFLWTLHENYIHEFRSLSAQLSLGATQVLQILIPVLGIPLSALLWPTALTGIAGIAWRAFTVLCLGAGIIMVHALAYPVVGSLLAGLLRPAGSPSLPPFFVHVASIIPDAIAFFLLFRWPAWHRLPPLSPARKALLLIALLPALVVLVLAFRQVRWFGVDAILWLAVLIAAAATLARGDVQIPWTRARRLAVAVSLISIFLPFPAFATLLAWRSGYPANSAAPQVITRDVAHHLRARTGGARVVVLATPTVTTWLMYFGGFSGIGTLYWENIDGLRTAAAIYAATPEEARQLIEHHGVTHILLCSWDTFERAYVRLAQEYGARIEPDRASFLDHLVSDSLPPWLAEMPYQLPPLPALRQFGVRILQVRERI
jgi:hypothetical protein